MRYAVLDVGSNTVSLLVVDAHRGAAPIPVHRERLDLRLAEHISPQGRISKQAISHLAKAVREASERSLALRCDEFSAFATSAIREAVNGEQILKTVAREAGVPLEVLPGAEEAELTFLAARRWYGWSSGRLLVADIGGGSLELAIGAGEQPEASVSRPLGAGRMFREFLRNDPPSRKELDSLTKHVRQTLRDTVEGFECSEVDHSVGTSKTFRQLARLASMLVHRRKDHDTSFLYADDLADLVDALVAMDLDERAGLPGISASRAPQLAAGAIVALETMAALDLEVLEVCPWALREGFILRKIDSLGVHHSHALQHGA